ncbi:MAG TPA: cupredoxin domain-containing protein [Anaerolineales bacterium]|nr:cupredoxin domain-containing protein [Anaerolineales bacterium]
MIRRTVPVGLLVLAALLAGCAKKPVDVAVTLTEFKVDASPLSVAANTPIHFTITNAGTVVHEFVVEPASAHDVPMEKDGQESEVEEIEPGEVVTLDWTITEPGEYHLACYTPGHFEAGMFTTFTVTP